MTHYIGIDIGGTNIKYGLLTSEGAILEDSEVKTNSSGKEIIATITEIVKKYQKSYEVIGLGVSAPGVILDSGYMVTGGAIHDFYGINLKEQLEVATGLPTSVENDANCAALAEKWLGAGKEYQHSLTVVVGTGIGGGIILNDQLFRGGSATAGEFGFMLVEPIKNQDTRLATLSLTGSVGCGVVNNYSDKNHLTEETRLNGKEIFEQADLGDEVAKEVIASFYNRLAIGLFNMSVTFDPQVILIGGAISNNPSFIIELTRQVNELKEQHRDMGGIKFPSIKPCFFLNKAGIVGATYKAILADKENG